MQDDRNVALVRGMEFEWCVGFSGMGWGEWAAVIDRVLTYIYNVTHSSCQKLGPL
jgi:hypothetical protein